MPVNKCCRSVEEQDVMGGGGGLFALTEEHAAVEAFAVQTLARKNPREIGLIVGLCCSFV